MLFSLSLLLEKAKYYCRRIIPRVTAAREYGFVAVARDNVEHMYVCEGIVHANSPATAQLISRKIHREIKRTALGELRVARFLTLCGRRAGSPGSR